VERGYGSSSPLVRQAAIETGLLLGLRSAHSACRHQAGAEGGATPLALAVLAIGGDPADLPLIEKAAEAPAQRGPALLALGYAGWPSAMERVLEWASADGGLARLAGEAFFAITGAAVEGALRAEPGGEEDLPPLDEDLGASLETGSEVELPVPDAGALQHWWRREQKRFAPAARYLGGVPYTPAALLDAFLGAPMRRRHLLGLELAVRSRRDYWIETRGLASAQLRAQRGGRFAARAESGQSFAAMLR